MQAGRQECMRLHANHTVVIVHRAPWPRGPFAQVCVTDANGTLVSGPNVGPMSPNYGCSESRSSSSSSHLRTYNLMFFNQSGWPRGAASGSAWIAPVRRKQRAVSAAVRVRWGVRGWFVGANKRLFSRTRECFTPQCQCLSKVLYPRGRREGGGTPCHRHHHRATNTRVYVYSPRGLPSCRSAAFCLHAAPHAPAQAPLLASCNPPPPQPTLPVAPGTCRLDAHAQRDDVAGHQRRHPHGPHDGARLPRRHHVRHPLCHVHLLDRRPRGLLLR